MEDRVKNLEISKLFNRLRKESFERIISKEGCKLRMYSQKAFCWTWHITSTNFITKSNPSE